MLKFSYRSLIDLYFLSSFFVNLLWFSKFYVALGLILLLYLLSKFGGGRNFIFVFVVCLLLLCHQFFIAITTYQYISPEFFTLFSVVIAILNGYLIFFRLNYSLERYLVSCGVGFGLVLFIALVFFDTRFYAGRLVNQLLGLNFINVPYVGISILSFFQIVKFRRMVYLWLLIPSLSYILMQGARKDLLILICVFTYFIYFLLRRLNFKNFSMFASMVSLVIFIIYFFYSMFVSRFGSLILYSVFGLGSDVSSRSRRLEYTYAFDLMADPSNLFGSSMAYIRDVIASDTAFAYVFGLSQHADNTFTELVYIGGLIGFFVFLMLFISYCYLCFKLFGNKFYFFVSVAYAVMLFLKNQIHIEEFYFISFALFSKLPIHSRVR